MRRFRFSRRIRFFLHLALIYGIDNESGEGGGFPLDNANANRKGAMTVCAAISNMTPAKVRETTRAKNAGHSQMDTVPGKTIDRMHKAT